MATQEANRSIAEELWWLGGETGAGTAVTEYGLGAALSSD
jgi:hypothetical protein